MTNLQIHKKLCRENLRRIIRLNIIRNKQSDSFFTLPDKIFKKVISDTIKAQKDNYETYDQLFSKYLLF